MHMLNIRNPKAKLAIFFTVAFAAFSVPASAGSRDAVNIKSTSQTKVFKSGRDSKITIPMRAASSQQAYLGRAPWICTPSGFGKTARCFLRSIVNQ